MSPWLWSEPDGKMPRVCWVLPLSGAILALASLWAAATEPESGCAESSADIVTDRPDTTNSSIVVPVASVQNENGVNLTSRDRAQTVDGTNSRWRLGVAPCAEILVDLPNYFGTWHGSAKSGFSDISPAVKWQIGPLPGDIDLSATAGIGLPVGTTRITGPGVQPYLQFPWSRELGNGWGLSGMVTAFFFPSEPRNKLIAEPTFVIEKSVTSRTDVFVEYVGYYPAHTGPSQLFNSGVAYRITPSQQIDFHAAFGLNGNAPHYVFGIGYSIRFDHLF